MHFSEHVMRCEKDAVFGIFEGNDPIGQPAEGCIKVRLQKPIWAIKRWLELWRAKQFVDQGLKQPGCNVVFGTDFSADCIFGQIRYAPQPADVAI